ncbi:TRAP-type C4-dicarboxylate transport system substrate-binding protein [Litoreibacter halocynthiae]|uniref:TRAP-type C4-dicarboxylate transport system substrate-binding protein n=1 Tax=Litoreibacter halocynthiae TaxID=1242689 RepID=A0A4V6Q3C0_9RHOB|nr:TRAP transporter substrate-binding protein [Litoreibacter halocynthiae]TDT77145.1 TRAP-type C4-dicarboxylate transport system substrate-binding protein [Litoreibacter halocynthiae]
MTIKNKMLALLAGAAFATTSFATLASAETQLALSSWLPPRHPIVVGAIKPWAKQVEEVTEGRVTVRVLAKPMGPPPSHYDMAADGIADITYGLHSFTTDDRFSRSRIGQFSFIGDDAVSGSKAFWNVYSGPLEAQKEHEGVKLLGLFVHGPGIFHNNARKIEKTEDFAGLKVRVPGGYVSELLTDLGATTLFMSSTEVYEKLSRGVIDGVTFTYEALTAFKLTDDIKYSMRVPGGIYNTTWFMVMNEGKWNEISEEDRAAIDAISGEAFAELVGTAWNDADTKALDAIDAAGIEVYDAPDAVLANIKTLAAKHEAAWAEAISGDGYDGVAALADMRKQSGVDY